MARLTTELRNGEQSFRRIALVALLYLISSAQALLPVDDPDIWWRFRTGQWIAEHYAVPFQDYFSLAGIGKPWIEYSWLFELIIYGVYAAFNLPGVVYFVVFMAVLITFTSHQLVRRSGLPFAAEVALVAAGMGAIKPVMTPRPWLFTILFFAVELLVIERVRRSSKTQLLWIMPALFLLWANIHIQFVYGLAVLLLLFGETLLVLSCRSCGYNLDAPAIASRPLGLVLIACVLATLLNPYHFLLYKQIFAYAEETGTFQNILEMHPMAFRSADSWLVLMLTVATAFILGWKRRWLPFSTLLFLFAAVLAFRARRDAWILVLVSIGIIGNCGGAVWQGDSLRLCKRELAFGAVIVGAMLYFLSLSREISVANLQAKVAEAFPVSAVRHVREKRLAGPLFNHLDWGGFLIWNLPEHPVSIDGRTNVSGDERLGRSIETWAGVAGWNSDPELINANLVIAEKKHALTSLLRVDSRYRISFEDNLAVVFVADPARNPK